MKGRTVIIRIPSFAAVIERSFLKEDEQRPVVVFVGEAGTRSLVISAEKTALRLGISPGQRSEEINPERFLLVPATLDRYKFASHELCRHISRFLPDPFERKIGVFESRWSGGDRFLDYALQDATNKVSFLGYDASWGIATESAAAEIAARLAAPGQKVDIPADKTREFLDKLPVDILPDLLPEYCKSLHSIGVHKLGDLVRLPDVILIELFGKEGPLLRKLALGGARPDYKREWRGSLRLGSDEENVSVVKNGVARLISQGFCKLTDLNKTPSVLTLVLIYCDSRRTVGRCGNLNKKHEGHWQTAASDLVDKIWTRRVRISEVRVTLGIKNSAPAQFDFFVPPQRIGREKRLADAVLDTRRKWGLNSLRFATSINSEENFNQAVQ